MYWADKIAKEIVSSGKFKPYWVDDMKTPSGFAHIGSIRGPLIHSLIFRALKDSGADATFTFVFNDFDPADELPLEYKETLFNYLGFPLKKVPSPEGKFGSLADLLVDDFQKVLRELGVEAEFLSSWDMYHKGKFDRVIKEALDAAEKIQDIYQKISGSAKKEAGWLPFQVICEKCGKLGTTKVYAWDGKEVSYKCEPDLVTWAKGCGHEGKVSPFGGTGKLPWKVDWAAHWKVIGVTIEGAGKDHASAGGSYDIAMEICQEVFKYPQPYKLPYEFFLIGGKKMSSSKGLGLKAHDATKFLPAEVARFLFARTDYREAIEFNPIGTMAIPDLFDEYDKAAEAYWTKSDENLARIFELSQPSGKLPEKMYIPRFRDVVQVIQMPDVKPLDYFADKKGEKLSVDEKGVLEQRIRYAKVWLENYAPEDWVFEFKKEIPESANKLSSEQKKYLLTLADLIEQSKDAKELETKMYELSQKTGISAKDAFSAIYLSLIGKSYGPKAAWLIFGIGKEKVLKRFKEI